MDDTFDRKGKAAAGDAAANDDLIVDLAKLLEEHNGQNTVALHVGDISSWTDYFVISTATSTGHLRGLLRHVYDFLDVHEIEPLRKHKNSAVNEEEGWVLLDCGSLIIHLMKEETRAFYELERLWFSGRVVYGTVS